MSLSSKFQIEHTVQGGLLRPIHTPPHSDLDAQSMCVHNTLIAPQLQYVSHRFSLLTYLLTCPLPPDLTSLTIKTAFHSLQYPHYLMRALC